ncbi:hypothetical protein DAH55_12210 [Sphingomonas koreensis]|uniref:hypothetical protein n=1 Tax=Sphingomonas koreensis TaxID=93064 RepID=UPI00082FA44C|nr:hypothetical protein [Sphingomonas koreensis]RSU68079.1 hypothetical protein DAH55_12210 [Sphingomonas koreensis]
MILLAAALLADPEVVTCSTRAGACPQVTQIINSDAQTCGLTVTFGPEPDDGLKIIADAWRFTVILPPMATDSQVACMAKARSTRHARLYPNRPEKKQ